MINAPFCPDGRKWFANSLTFLSNEDVMTVIIPKVLADPDANRFVSGIAVHWYANDAVPPGVLTLTHDLFPDRFLLATEACNGKKTIVSSSVAILMHSVKQGRSKSQL